MIVLRPFEVLLDLLYASVSRCIIDLADSKVRPADFSRACPLSAGRSTLFFLSEVVAVAWSSVDTSASDTRET